MRGSGIPLRRCSALSSCRSSPLHTQLLPSSRSPLLKSVYLQPSLLERKPKRLFRLYRSQMALLIYRLGASRGNFHSPNKSLRVVRGMCPLNWYASQLSRIPANREITPNPGACYTRRCFWGSFQCGKHRGGRRAAERSQREEKECRESPCHR
ncbi:hypothetical protein Anapl_09561 [Anas platyrhynchos]|uniref:Uncharacterized protein n=1 Tax=Anas platyrhynchos TaxID=8839 RepID=R0LWC7_ANAPL|nr:hypothetical protein Anapl_09561 [Anas platyrhynchos]